MKAIKYLSVIFLIFIIIGAFVVWKGSEKKIVLVDQGMVVIQNIVTPTIEVKKIITKAETVKSIYYEVPFTSQAPFGGWKDPKQQNGCEEAAVLMAVYWAKGKSLTKQEALQQIIAISDFEQKTYGEYRDTSAADTLDRIIKGYFQYTRAFTQEITSFDDIYNQLSAGRLVIVPMNGQLLNNPNYTQPGPLEHMVVVKGYDVQNNEFITNDPGTRNGFNYRYPVAVFIAAIRDYPTGYHQPINEIKKVMIVIEKQ